MKYLITKVLYCLIAVQIVFLYPVNGQVKDMEFMSGGLSDAEAILKSYLTPYANILGADLNSGWYNTAKPHKLGGLDLTATVSWAKAPVSALTYDLAELELSGTVDPANSVAPTIAGSQDNRPELAYSADIPGGPQNIELASLTMPNGAGVDFFPLPMAQLTVGLPFGTDVSVRYIPNIAFREYGEIGLWGVGGRHSISQWIPVLNKIKVINISIQGGYTRVTSTAHVSVEPPAVEIDPNPGYNWDDQFFVQQVEGWTINLIASQTIPVLTFYQGIGYSSSLVDLAVEGHFPMQSVVTDVGSDLGKTTYEIVEDPIEMNFENFKNLRLNAGVRIKLGILTLHYDYTHTLYSAHSVGVGFSFR